MGEGFYHYQTKRILADGWSSLGWKTDVEVRYNGGATRFDVRIERSDEVKVLEVIDTHIPEWLDKHLNSYGRSGRVKEKLVIQNTLEPYTKTSDIIKQTIKHDESMIRNLYQNKTEFIRGWAKALEDEGEIPINEIARRIINELIDMGCKHGTKHAYDVLDRKYKRDYNSRTYIGNGEWEYR